MKKRIILKNTPFIVTIFINILLFIAVFNLMNYVQKLLNSDVSINLTEIVTQNKNVITSNLRLEMNNMDLISKQIAERVFTDGDLNRIFLEYIREKEDDRVFFADKNGKAIFFNGHTIDISGRKYFTLALENIPNISDRTVSRLNGDDIFVISVPIKYNDEIIGTAHKMFSPQEIYDVCSVSLFSSQGSMYIINSQGYVLISSEQDEYSSEADNYYRMIYQDNPDSANKLKADIQNEKSGFMETVVSGKKIFSAYTPIDQIYDWYLISSIATSAVSPNANIVIRMFYLILIVIVLVFGFSMLYFTYYKNKQQTNLEHIAFVDTVTKDNTYTKFIVELENIFKYREDEDFFIFTFDIDNFKYINNFYGFDLGDKILKNINEIFSEKLYKNEIIARVYSDHFVVLLKDASQERLNELFSSEITIDGIQIYMSAGLYPITDYSENVNLMVDKANMAVQSIKGMRYKHVAVYSDEFDKKMIYDEQLKRSVETALEKGEIIPFYQPKVNINTKELVGAEALARWRTSEGKLISPGDFIPVCERTGLIVEVDMAIFEKTLQFIKYHLDNGIECTPISVNFSRTHLLNKEFINIIISMLNKYNVPKNLIELELTETVIFDNYDTIENFINQLHNHGLCISMDDFGSGYSSLHMLKDIDIDILKIDRGFLKNTANSDKQKVIFSAIIQMAEKLKIKVVAEGVENLDNVEMMKEFGCYIAQGYYYAKPMDRVDFDEIYSKRKV